MMDQSSNGKLHGSLLTAHLAEGSSDGKSVGLLSQASDDQDHANVLRNVLDDDDDGFELTFSLDQPRGSESPGGQTRQLFRSEEYRQLFHLPPEEILIRDFNCALQKKILLQGHMYLFEHYVCFYSNIFGYEKKKVIMLKEVTSIHKARTAGLFPNAIEIVSWGKKNFFASFLFRDEAYRLIVEGWTRHSRYARALPDSQNNLSSSMPRSDHGQLAQDQQDASFSESSYESRDIMEVATEQDGEAEKEPENESKTSDIGVSEASEPIQPIQANGTQESKATETEEAFTSKSSDLWNIEDEDAPKAPEHYKTVLQCELPVDVQEFFQLFFSNDSKKFCESFHKKCGDEEFHCTDWSKHRHFGHVRDVSFRHPIKFYFGPKATYCQEVQRYRVYRNSHLIVETSQQMNDIPYGDYFRVEGRWDVIPSTNVDAHSCSVRIFVDVSFSKKTVWKGKIEQGTCDECKDVFATWHGEALSALQDKGLIDDKHMKRDSRNQSTHMQSGSAKEGSQPLKLKRKSEESFYQVQSHRKIPKNSIASTNDTNVKDECMHHEQPLQNSPSRPSKTSLQQPQESTMVAFLTSSNQMKLVVAMCIMVAILLIQMGSIIALTRVARTQYMPVRVAKGEEYCGSHQKLCGRQDTVWLEQRVEFLQEEIALAETLLQNIQYNINQLKLNARLSEKGHQDLRQET